MIILTLKVELNILTFIQKINPCFTITVDVQAQTALQRKWAQWKYAWGKTGWGTPITKNHFNNSSITETSRATINLEQPSASSEQNENRPFMSNMQQKANGQQKNSKTCSNGEMDRLNKLETTDI